MTEDERVRAWRGQSNTARVGGSAPGGERREGGQEGRSWPPVHTGPMCSLAAASRASTPLLFFRFLRLPLHSIPPLIRVIRYPPHRRWLPVIAFTLNTSLSLEEGITITRTTKRCAGTYNRLKGSGIRDRQVSFGESCNLARAGRDRVRRNASEEDGGKIACPSVPYPRNGGRCSLKHRCVSKRVLFGNFFFFLEIIRVTLSVTLGGAVSVSNVGRRRNYRARDRELLLVVLKERRNSR